MIEDTATVQFRVKDLRLFEPANGPRLDDMLHTASVVCPRCRNHIEIIAEVSAIEVKRLVGRYCERVLEATILMIGQADEFFEQTSGQSYRQSIERQAFLRLERQVTRFRGEVEGEGDET